MAAVWKLKLNVLQEAVKERAVRQARVGWAEGTQAILHIHSAGK